MKRLIAIALLAWIVAGAAWAQNPGSIGVFANSAGTDCNIVDTGSLVTVHLLHVYTDGATAVQFKLDIGTTGWMYLNDNYPWPTKVGVSITGVSIGYGYCLAGTIHLMSVNFFGTNAAECTYISIVPDPTAHTGMIEAVDCSIPQNIIFPTGGQAIVNATPDCTCSVPVRDATWGGIKALYR